MLINAKNFKHPNEYNLLSYDANKNQLRIHAYARSGQGYINVVVLETPVSDESFEFMLSKQDYTFLSKKGEVEISVQKTKLHVVDGANLYKFSSFETFTEVELNIDAMTRLAAIDKSVISMARMFTYKNDDNPFITGVVFAPNYVMATDRKSLGRIKMTTGVDKKISTNAALFDMLVDYEAIFTDGKRIAITYQNEIAYYSLIEGTLGEVSLKDEFTKIKLDIKQFKTAIQDAKYFNSIIRFVVDAEKIAIKINAENGNEFSADIPLSESEFTNSLDYAIPAEGILKVIAVAQMNDSDELLLSDRALVYKDDNTEAFILRTRVHGGR